MVVLFQLICARPICVQINLLDDIHNIAAQGLIKKHFPQFGGLQNMVMQNLEMMKSFSGNNDSLQIVHVKLRKIDLLVFISTVGCAEDEIELYDSLQPNQVWISKQLLQDTLGHQIQ